MFYCSICGGKDSEKRRGNTMLTLGALERFVLFRDPLPEQIWN